MCKNILLATLLSIQVFRVVNKTTYMDMICKQYESSSLQDCVRMGNSRVCALTEFGSKGTQLNLCFACLNPTIVSYVPGSCPTLTGVQSQASSSQSQNAGSQRQSQTTVQKPFQSNYVPPSNLPPAPKRIALTNFYQYSSQYNGNSQQHQRSYSNENIFICPDDVSRYLASCLYQYNKVCATTLDLSQKTYSSGCQACKDGHVVFYKKRACTSSEISERRVANTCPASLSYMGGCYGSRLVCAYRRDGSRTTQADCGVCIDKKVFSYQYGACIEEPIRQRSLLCATSRQCSSVTGPVCAIYADGRRQRFYSGCAACQDRSMVQFIVGECF